MKQILNVPSNRGSKVELEKGILSNSRKKTKLRVCWWLWLESCYLIWRRKISIERLVVGLFLEDCGGFILITIFYFENLIYGNFILIMCLCHNLLFYSVIIMIEDIIRKRRKNIRTSISGYIANVAKTQMSWNTKLLLQADLKILFIQQLLHFVALLKLDFRPESERGNKSLVT